MSTSENSPTQVAERLQHRRELAAARKRDRLARIQERSERRMQARAIRQEAARDRAASDLERAKIASDIAHSAEARALRVQRTRTLTLWALLPVFIAFTAWSTTGVHAGAAAMTGATSGTAMWWALWALEPALLGTVAWIILCRARLASAGGTLGAEADHIMWGCLTTSVVLNAVGHWPTEVSAQAIGSLIAHSLGPIGAAMTAHLIGIIEQAVTTARPSEGEGVKSLSELTETTHTSTVTRSIEQNTRDSSEEPSLPPSGWVNAPPGAELLPLVTCPTTTPTSTTETERRSTHDQRERTSSEEAAPTPRKQGRKPRSDKGTTVPGAAKTTSETSARSLSDDELADLLETAITDARLSQEPSVNAVQKCLSVGFDRAKRVIELRANRSETAAPELAVVGDTEVA